MSDTNSFKSNHDEETTVQIGNHIGIETPFFAPEIKNWHYDLHVTLDYREALDDNNPILVPAWDWPRLRERRAILQRTDGETSIGEKEVSQLEKSHPLIHFFPPELFAFRGKTDILQTYLLKRNKEAKSEFKEALQNGDVDTAFNQLPQFARPFVQSNFTPILTDLDISNDTISGTGADPAEIWKNLPDSYYDGFFGQLAKDAMGLPSAVTIPPVPLIDRYDSDLITAMCKANSTMSELANSNEEPRSFYHLYLHYTAFSDGRGDEEDTASKALNILRNEVEKGEYAGIAITIYNGKEVLEKSTVPRVRTFFQHLSSFAAEQNLPVICPRSEWLGFWATDFGIDGFSSLYNGNFVYRSGGGVDDVDRYGYTMVPSEARSLKIRSDDGADIEEQLTDGGLSGLDVLPDKPPNPPTDFEPGNELQAEYGTSFYYRRHFGKPQKLNHVWEARTVRSEDGQSARGHLEDSENEYVEFDEE